MQTNTLTHTILLAALLAASAGGASAQDKLGRIRSLLVRVEQAYRNAGELQFEVAYSFANLHSPDKPLETMSGEVQMDQSRCRFVIDGAETVVTEHFMIRVLPDQHLLYVSSAAHPDLMDPVGSLDSVLANLQGIQVDLVEDGATQTLTFRFPPGRRYNRITMTIDEHTALLQDVAYDIQTQGLVSRDEVVGQGQGGQYEQEGIMDIHFSGYRHGGFDEDLFSDDRYLTKSGDTYGPSARYKDYRVFLANSPH